LGSASSDFILIKKPSYCAIKAVVIANLFSNAETVVLVLSQSCNSGPLIDAALKAGVQLQAVMSALPL